MLHVKKHTLCLVLIAIMLVAILGGCTQTASSSTTTPNATSTLAQKETETAESTNSEKVVKELEIWFPSMWPWAAAEASAEWANQANYKAIENACGIKLKVVVPTGDYIDLIGPMIASDTLPATMVLPNGDDPNFKQMHDADMLYSITDIATQYAPGLLKEIPQENFTIWNNKEDGKLWGYMMNIGTEAGRAAYTSIGIPPVPNTCIMFARKDILAAFGKQDITSFDDYVNYLYFCKEKYPDVEPIKLDSSADLFLGSLGNYLAATFGVSPSHFFISSDGSVQVSMKDPKYVDMLRWLNKLYRDGIISANQFTDQTQQMDEKTNGAKYGSFAYAVFHVYNTINKTITDNGMVDKTYIAVGPIQKESIPFKVAQNPSSRGNYVWVVTKSADPETAAKWLDYALSVEGQRQMFLGIKDTDYTIDADGIAVINEQNAKDITSDLEAYVSKYNVISKFIPFGTEEGWCNYIDKWLIPYELADVINKRLPSSTWEDIESKGLANLETVIDRTTDDGVIMTKIKESMAKTAIKMIAATSDAEFESRYEDGLNELKSLNVVRYEQILTDEHNAQLASIK